MVATRESGRACRPDPAIYFDFPWASASPRWTSGPSLHPCGRRNSRTDSSDLSLCDLSKAGGTCEYDITAVLTSHSWQKGDILGGPDPIRGAENVLQLISGEKEM